MGGSHRFQSPSRRIVAAIIATGIYGAIMSEAFGHLSSAVSGAAAIFEAELQAPTESLVSKNG
jgi:hypothetical protein